MSKSKNPSSNYEIPLHKCQLCYQNTGRYILDCYCVVCDDCYRPNEESICIYCEKPTRGKRLDTRDPNTFEKIGYMFNKPEVPLLRGLEIVQFQANVANKYFQFIENKLQSYEKAVYELVRSNPRLDKYFSDRIKGFRVPPKTPHMPQPQTSKNDTPDPKKDEKVRYNSEPNDTKAYYNNGYPKKYQAMQPEIKRSPNRIEDSRSYNKPNRLEKHPAYNVQTRQPKYQREDHRKMHGGNYKQKKHPNSYQSEGDSSYRTNIHSSQLKPYIQNFRRN